MLLTRTLAAASALMLMVSASACSPRTEPDCGVAGMTGCPEPSDHDLPNVADMLTWNQSERVVGFRNDYRAYPGDLFRHGDPFPLPTADRRLTDASYTIGGITHDLDDYLNRQSVTGMLVLKDGKIAYEHYGAGNDSSTLWTSRSVGKSVVSTLVGIAVKEGKIASLDDPVTKYEPDFAGTAFDGVSVRQLITHTSGVAWNEDYTDPSSDFAKLTACEAAEDTYRCVYSLVHGLKRKPGVTPGEVWSYTTGGAWLLGDLLEKATGTNLATYLQDKIWKPFGMADDGVWHSYELGRHDMGGHGFNATLTDWGRFGLFVMRDGELRDGTRTLPDGWVRDARTWTTARGSVTPSHPEGTYGYQWWNNSIAADAGDVRPPRTTGMDENLWALGIFGQVIMVDQRQNLVMVQWSTRPQAEPPFNTLPLETSLMFSAIAAELNRQ
ncbi:serine hydrolase domain-containing protein [Mycolicibacterium peregrinum]|uniref:serine hydrolase domain-containing protein n=1 Tax=Mycolicibacterium peregrinum TaxID=43304 RepID=UPI003AAC8989